MESPEIRNNCEHFCQSNMNNAHFWFIKARFHKDSRTSLHGNTELNFTNQLLKF